MTDRRRESHGDRAYWAMLGLPTVFLAVFYVVPVVNVLVMSVTVPVFGLGNYALLVESESIRKILGTTARVCLVTTALSVTFGYALAYWITHAAPLERRLLTLAVVLTFWVSALIRAFAWVALLQPRGLVNTLLAALGLISEPLPLVRNELGVVTGMVHYMLPYAVLPMLANMGTIDPALVRAARALGATPRQAFWRVFLPLSVPGLAGATILVFIFSLGFYITPAVLGGGKVVMIAEYISLQITETLRWGTAATLSVALVTAVVVLTALMSRFLDVGRVVKSA